MKDNLTKYLRVRLTDEEYKKLQALTIKYQFDTISDFVRHYLFSDRKNLIDPKAYLQGMNELTVAVNRVGNNINQYAKFMNKTKDVENIALMREWNKLFAEYMNLLREVNLQIEKVYSLKMEKI